VRHKTHQPSECQKEAAEMEFKCATKHTSPLSVTEKLQKNGITVRHKTHQPSETGQKHVFRRITEKEKTQKTINDASQCIGTPSVPGSVSQRLTVPCTQQRKHPSRQQGMEGARFGMVAPPE